MVLMLRIISISVETLPPYALTQDVFTQSDIKAIQKIYLLAVNVRVKTEM